MIHPPQPDSALSEVLGDLAVAAIGWIALRLRRRQNDRLAGQIDDALADQVRNLQLSLNTVQDLLNIHTDKLKEENQVSHRLTRTASDLTRRLESLEKTVRGLLEVSKSLKGTVDEAKTLREAVERAEGVLKQFNDTIARAKAGEFKQLVEGSHIVHTLDDDSEPR